MIIFIKKKENNRNFFDFNLDKHPFWNNAPTERTTIEDAPQLEYDEHHIDLIADRGK
jgi:hypothetical protein